MNRIVAPQKVGRALDAAVYFIGAYVRLGH
jgi:hypothetical protein